MKVCIDSANVRVNETWQLQFWVAEHSSWQPSRVVSEPSRGTTSTRDELCRGVEGHKGLTSFWRRTDEKCDKQMNCWPLTGILWKESRLKKLEPTWLAEEYPEADQTNSDCSNRD